MRFFVGKMFDCSSKETKIDAVEDIVDCKGTLEKQKTNSQKKMN